MVDEDFQMIVAVLQGICHIKSPYRSSHEFFRVGMTIKSYGGIGSHAFKLQEVAFTILLLCSKCLIIYSVSVQIAVAKLTAAIVVIEIVREINAHDGIVSHRTMGSPAIVEAGDIATAFTFRSWKANFRAAHGYARRNGNTTLLVVVDGTIEMVNHPIVLHYIRFVGKHLIVRF